MKRHCSLYFKVSILEVLAIESGNEPLTVGSEDGHIAFKAIVVLEVVCPRKMILAFGQLIAFGSDLAMKLRSQPFVKSAISCPLKGLGFIKKVKKFKQI